MKKDVVVLKPPECLYKSRCVARGFIIIRKQAFRKERMGEPCPCRERKIDGEMEADDSQRLHFLIPG